MSQLAELGVLGERIAAAGVGAAVKQEVDDAAERAEIGCREQQISTVDADPMDLLQGEHRIDPQVLEDLVEEHDVETRVGEGQGLGFDVTAGDPQPEPRDRGGESLRRKIDAGDVVAREFEGRGEEQRHRADLQDAGPGGGGRTHQIEVEGQPPPVVADVIRIPALQPRIADRDRARRLRDQLAAPRAGLAALVARPKAHRRVSSLARTDPLTPSRRTVSAWSQRSTPPSSGPSPTPRRSGRKRG